MLLFLLSSHVPSKRFVATFRRRNESVLLFLYPESRVGLKRYVSTETGLLEKITFDALSMQRATAPQMLFEHATFEVHVLQVKLCPCGVCKGAAAECDVGHAAISNGGVVEQTVFECDTLIPPSDFGGTELNVAITVIEEQ